MYPNGFYHYYVRIYNVRSSFCSLAIIELHIAHRMEHLFIDQS